MRSILFSLFALFALSIAGAVYAAIDINSANETQLETLPGIGPGKAKDIVADRNANGPFRSVDALSRVRGIGDKTLTGLREHITVSANAVSTTKAPADGARQTPAPTAPQKRFPWGIVIVAVLAGGGVAWFVFRRRSSAANAEASRQDVSEHPAAVPAPVPSSRNLGAAGAGGTAAGSSGGGATPPPAPAGPKPAGHAGQVPSAGVSSDQPMPPAGMRPAGMPPTASKQAGTGAPPAPAGSKPK